MVSDNKGQYSLSAYRNYNTPLRSGSSESIRVVLEFDAGQSRVHCMVASCFGKNIGYTHEQLQVLCQLYFGKDPAHPLIQLNIEPRLLERIRYGNSRKT
jgi:hypothetical protein